jgi:hypothetical protein
MCSNLQVIVRVLVGLQATFGVFTAQSQLYSIYYTKPATVSLFHLFFLPKK